MPEIYTDEWSQALLKLANSRDDLSAKVPAGEWRIAVEIEGDGISPYIPNGETKHFFVRLLDGKIEEYSEHKEKIPGKGLNYRINGPAAVFDEIAAGIHDLMISTLMYAPPIDVNYITKALSTWKVEKKTEFFRARLRSMSINDFLDKHFEHDRIKAMLAFHAAVCGYYTDLTGLAISFPFMVGKIDNWRLAKDGSHRLAHALWRQMRRHNVTLHPTSPVEQILLENGRAVGVKTADGREFMADKLVASSLDLDQTFNKMLPSEALPEDIQSDFEKYEYQDGSLFSVHMAMDKIPTYKAAEFDPDINQAWVLNMGYECLENFNNDWNDIRNNQVPESPRLNVAINSLFDPTGAPDDKTTGLIRVFAPYDIDNKGPGVWDTKFKTVYMNRCIDTMDEFCEDFSRDDIIHAKPYTPLDISEKLTNMKQGDWMVGKIADSNLMANRPSPLMSQYRTPVDGL